MAKRGEYRDFGMARHVLTLRIYPSCSERNAVKMLVRGESDSSAQTSYLFYFKFRFWQEEFYLLVDLRKGSCGFRVDLEYEFKTRGDYFHSSRDYRDAIRGCQGRNQAEQEIPQSGLLTDIDAPGFTYSVSGGLSNSQAEAMRRQYGRNALTPPPKIPWWKELLSRFSDPTIRILLVAALISLGVTIVERSV